MKLASGIYIKIKDANGFVVDFEIYKISVRDRRQENVFLILFHECVFISADANCLLLLVCLHMNISNEIKLTLVKTIRPN